MAKSRVSSFPTAGEVTFPDAAFSFLIKLQLCFWKFRQGRKVGTGGCVEVGSAWRLGPAAWRFIVVTCVLHMVPPPKSQLCATYLPGCSEEQSCRLGGAGIYRLLVLWTPLFWWLHSKLLSKPHRVSDSFQSFSDPNNGPWPHNLCLQHIC